MVNMNHAVGGRLFDAPTMLLPCDTSSNLPSCDRPWRLGGWRGLGYCVLMLCMVGFCVFAGKWGDFKSGCGLPYVEGFVQDC